MNRTDVAAGGWRDLVLAGGLTVLAALATVVPAVPEPVVWALAVPFFTVLPGYAVVSALFPEQPIAVTDDRTSADGSSGPSWIVRAATSLAVSVVVVAAIGVGLAATVGITRLPAVTGVSVTTIAFLLIAGWRRSTRPASRRAAPLARTSGVWRGFGSTPLQRGALLVALLALLSMVTVAAAYPSSDTAYTEFYLLEETADGELVAADFPSTVETGQNVSVHLGIENAGTESQSYDVVARATPQGANASTERLDRFQVTVDGGDRAVLERSVALQRPANRTQLQFLLFENGVGSEPTAANADTELRLWVEVQAGDGR